MDKKKFNSIEEIVSDRNLTIPQKQKAIQFEHIYKYCSEHNEIEWLKEASNKPAQRHNRKTHELEACRPSFLEIRNDFLRKFFPKLLGETKPKKPTIYELIDAL